MIRKTFAVFLTIIIICLSFCSCRNTADALQNDKTFDTDKGATSQSESKWVNTPIFKDFIPFDADGDGVDDHVVEHNMVAMSGGHGGYELYVYAKSDIWGYDKIFNSDDYFAVHPDMDIQITEMVDGRIVFHHSSSGYEVKYVVDDEDYPYLFNDDGMPVLNPNFVVDTFKTVEVVDVDGDGVRNL